MINLLTSVVLPLLFVGSGTLAVSVVWSSWRRHAGAFARLRAELADLGAAGAAAPVVRVRETARRTGAGAVLPGPAGPRRAAVRPVRAAAGGRLPAERRAAA